jgi:hypothetical protein
MLLDAERRTFFLPSQGRNTHLLTRIAGLFATAPIRTVAAVINESGERKRKAAFFCHFLLKAGIGGNRLGPVVAIFQRLLCPCLR